MNKFKQKIEVGDLVKYKNEEWEVGFINKKNWAGTLKLQKGPLLSNKQINKIDPNDVELIKKNSPLDLENIIGSIGGYNLPLSRSKKSNRKIKEMKTFKQLIKETKLQTPEKSSPKKNMYAWGKRRPDLSTKEKSLTHLLAQLSKSGELQRQFGKDYTPEKFMNWIKDKAEGHHISDEYFSNMETKLKAIKNSIEAMKYVYNAFLRGAALGLNENES